MNLREATILVIADALNDNSGNLGFEQVANMSKSGKLVLAQKLIESDEFLISLEENIESALGEHFDAYGDEYGIEE